MEFLHFGLKDAVDILIVWIIFYEILKLFKGTRTTYILAGLAVIIIFALIAQFFNLQTVNALISPLETVGVLALIIIFQPEIRRALAMLGRNPGIRKLFKSSQTYKFEEVAEATFQIRARGWGAIIVYENKMGLRDIIEETGVLMDAKISVPLLISIFSKNSPLHDGAVLLKEDKIIAARVILPVSRRSELRLKYGTRHRAAIGITEGTDAVAIVVSEERGEINVVYQGEMNPVKSPEELIRLLERFLREEK